MKKNRRGPLPAWAWAGFAVLLALTVPWYFPAGGAVEPRVWAFPLWGAIVAGFALLLSIYTAVVYLFVWDDLEKRR